jgi:hypothetical protein
MKHFYAVFSIFYFKYLTVILYVFFSFWQVKSFLLLQLGGYITEPDGRSL